MKFTKKFLLGLSLVFIGILLAFDRVSDYRVYSIVIFWTGIVMSLCGLILMYKGIQQKEIE